MAGPLAGITVIDLSWGSPGAITGMLLADYGARVVKVERPGAQMPASDGARVARAAWDRGKWSIVADLATDDGRATVDALCARADVLLESFGLRGGTGAPGGQGDDIDVVATTRAGGAYGLSPDEVRARHPHLVHCSLSGYGEGTPWSHRPGYDALVAARLGQMAEQAGPRDGAKFLGHPSVAYGTAFVATIGTLAALRARHVTGRGQLVDASLLDGVLAQSCMNWWWSESGASYLARSGSEQGFGRGRIVTDLFQCSDGEWVMVHTGGAGGFKKAMELLGFGDRIRSVEGALEMSVPLDDDEYEVARHLIFDVFRTRPRAEWVQRFHAADLAALPVLKPGEILGDDQVAHARAAVRLDDPVAGPLTMAGPVIRFAGSPAATPDTAPTPGRDDARLVDLLAAPPRTAVGAAASTPATDRAGVLDGRGPLHGIRVLDFSAFFATAYGAKLLSDLGADVIKVETLEGDQMRPLPDPFEACQRGKRTIALDLRAPAAQAVVRELVRDTDIVFLNLRPGKADKIGIGYEQLRAVKPDLVYCYLPGFGSSGPKSGLKSFAPLLSGFTGLLWESAGAGAERPVRRAMGNEDYNNGFVGAVAALMALAHRDRTGEGQYVENPQLHSSLLVTTEQCVGADGALRAALTLDAEQMGWGPLYRLYGTADGHVCIAVVGEGPYARLRKALGATELDGVTYAQAVGESSAQVVASLTSRFAALGAAEAFALLDGAGVPCEVPLDHPHLPDLLWADWALESQRVLEHVHPVHGLIREVGFVTRLSDNPCEVKGPAPLLGQHSVEILRGLGHDEASIDALLSSGVCVQAQDA